MIRTASVADLPALRELFRRANDAPYDLSAVTEEKCFGDGLDGTPVTRLFLRDGCIEGIAVRCGKWLRILAVARESRRCGIGTALLADAHDVRVVAAEPGNYFTPGVFAEDAETRRFLRARGFREGGSTHNLHVDLGGIMEVGDAIRATHDDAARLLGFVTREFGRAWRFEISKAFARDVPTAFITQNGAEITGFAVHDANNRGLGCFGPTGVAKPLRGRGLGRELLLASLADLRRLGYSRAVIPWTDAVAFYRKASGAEPAHRFITLMRA